MKAADITEDEFLAAMDAVVAPWGVSSLWDIQAAMLGYPPKVVKAKAASLVRRGILDGCPCGCRGDFHRAAEASATV